MIEAASSAGTYFDGSGYVNDSGTWVSDAGGHVGWLGTAHASASDKGCFANGTSRTFMGWAYRDTSSGADTIIWGNSSGTSDCNLGLATGSNDFAFSPNNSTFTTWTGAWPGNGEWVHWAVVFNETTNSISGYINGVLVSSSTNTAQYGGASTFHIGDGSPWDGKQAWVSVHERALTAGEILECFQLASAPFGVNIERDGQLIEKIPVSEEFNGTEIQIPPGTDPIEFRASHPGEIHLDAIQVTERSTPYFDGDTPGCSWTGTPHGSTSTRRGSGSDTKRFLDCIFDLESKLEKLAREGGTARRVLPDGTPITFDILDATYPADWQRTISQGRMEFNFELTAKPFARQPPVTLATVNKPASTSVATIDTGTVPGNAPALVRLKVNDTGTAQRNHLLVGSAQAADPAMLLAKTRQLLGGALVNSPTSAATTNGGLTNGTVKMTMNAAWRPVLSTNDSAPAYQTHEGIQRVLARVFFPSSNTDDVNLKFEWAQADLARWSTSDLTDGSQYVTLTGNQQIGVWQWVDLGTINLTKPRSDVWNDSAGWRWEGRLTARANSGDIYVDALSIIPAGNFLAEMFANPQIPESNDAVIGLDNGTLPGGTLNGTAATVGGNWSEIGGVSGFERTGPGNMGTIARSPASNDAAMKFARIGTSTQGPIYASCSFGALLAGYGGVSIGGLLVRYTDANNYAVASIVTAGNGAQTLAFWVYKAGALVLNQMVALPSVSNSWGISLAINSNGSGIVAAASGSTVRSVSWPANSDLATGTLSSGGFGLAHRVTAQTMSDLWGTPQFRSLTNTTIEDAVIFPSRSAILTHATALRYDSAGNSLGEIGRYQGDRLTVPAGSSSRIAILDGRVAPGSADNNLDTLSMELSLIPRVVDVPEPV